MTRCDHCDDPIGTTGLVCVSCKRAFCKRCATEGVDIGCCDSCVRQCLTCERVLPANQGVDVGDLEWICGACFGSALSAALGPVQVAELMPPHVGIHESELETVN